MAGPFPQGTEEREDGLRRFREALAGRHDFVIVFHGVGIRSATDLGIFMRWLREAGAELGFRSVRIVCDDRRTGDVLSVVDSPFRVYTTEEEALSPNKTGGCPGISVVTFLVLAGLSTAIVALVSRIWSCG